MPVSDFNGLRAAVDNYLADSTIHQRHDSIAAACRKAVTEAGLELYLESGWANTVTVINVPAQTTAADILRTMQEDYNIMIAGSFDILAGKVIRIGHMGENAYPEKMAPVMDALQNTLRKLGVPVQCDMKDVFLKAL